MEKLKPWTGNVYWTDILKLKLTSLCKSNPSWSCLIKKTQESYFHGAVCERNISCPLHYSKPQTSHQLLEYHKSTISLKMMGPCKEFSHKPVVINSEQLHLSDLAIRLVFNCSNIFYFCVTQRRNSHSRCSLSSIYENLFFSRQELLWERSRQKRSSHSYNHDSVVGSSIWSWASVHSKVEFPVVFSFRVLVRGKLPFPHCENSSIQLAAFGRSIFMPSSYSTTRCGIRICLRQRSCGQSSSASWLLYRSFSWGNCRS